VTDLAVGSELGEFRVTGVLGEGGMGIVYAAERPDGQEVALKVLHAEMAADESLRKRFVRESNYASSLDHPNIIPVIDAGDVDGVLYVAMAYVHGQNLREVLMREAPFDTERTLATLAPVADALEAVHAQGIVHRDVKPENILIASGEGPEPAGHPYLTDFGLGKDPGRDSGALTAIGQFVGTLNYTAPEQIMGEEPTRHADVYQFGCVMFECLTGRSPYAADNAADILKAQLDSRPPRITEANPDLPTGLDDVLIRALAREPSARFDSCVEVMAAAADAIGAPLEGAAPPPAPVMGGSPGTTLKMKVAEGNAQGSEIAVDDELLIGRLEDGAGKLADDPEISRRHARVFRTGEEAYSIEDLGSTNGTFVNGMRVEGAKPLSAADVITVGNTKLVVQGAEAPPSGAPVSVPEADLDTTTRPVDGERPAPAPTPAPAAPAPSEPAPVETPPARPAPPPLSVRVEIDPENQEARLWFDEDEDPIRLIAEEGRWRLAD
jgi:predicted Ser/Thr protein kinase